jgi:hypothetical protein
MEKVTQLITRLQQICTTLGETAMSENAVLWNKLSTIVVVGGQVRCLLFWIKAGLSSTQMPSSQGCCVHRSPIPNG